MSHCGPSRYAAPPNNFGRKPGTADIAQSIRARCSVATEPTRTSAGDSKIVIVVAGSFRLDVRSRVNLPHFSVSSEISLVKLAAGPPTTVLPRAAPART